jgi:hypothetical protein
MHCGARFSPLAANHGAPMVLCSPRRRPSKEDSAEPLHLDSMAEIRTNPYPFIISIGVVDNRMDGSHLIKPEAHGPALL